MTKSKIAFVFLLVGISSAEAASPQKFVSLEGMEKACKLAKFSAGKWVQSDEKDLNGQNISNVTASKANNDFSNFKYQNTWYASRNECLKDSDSGGSATATSGGSSPSKFALEFKIQKTLLLSSIDASGTVAGVNSVDNTSYSSGLGIDGRFDYHWKDNQYFFLDLSTLPASQTVTYNSPFTGKTEAVSDNIFMVNVGYLQTFQKPIFGLKPYLAGMIGYGSLSGTVQNVMTYSGGGIDLGVEGGLIKDFSPHWSALASLGLTYLSINPKVSGVNSTSLSSIYPNGETLGSRSYTHFTLAIGIKYNF